MEVIEADLTWMPSVMNYVQFGVGYIDELETMTYRTALAEPLTERVSANFSTSYDEEIGRWSGFVGLSFDLSPRRISDGSLAMRSRGNGDLLRGASSVILSESSFQWFEGDPDVKWLQQQEAAKTMQREKEAFLKSLAENSSSQLPGGSSGGGGGGGGGGPCTTCPGGFMPFSNGCVQIANPSNFISCPP